MMRLDFQFKGPKPWNTVIIPSMLADVIKSEVDAVRSDLKQTTENWDHSVEFVVEAEVSGDKVQYSVGTDDKPWWWLNDGTSVRYATMSSDYIRHTNPGVLASGPGAGQMLYVSKNRPHEGIEARHWDIIIADRHQGNFATKLLNGLLRFIGGH